MGGQIRGSWNGRADAGCGDVDLFLVPTWRRSIAVALPTFLGLSGVPFEDIISCMVRDDVHRYHGFINAAKYFTALEGGISS